MSVINRILLSTVFLIILSASGALAETQFICSITESIECSEGLPCSPPDFGGVTPPTFMHLNLDKSIITLLAPANRRGEKTAIDVATETDDGWILSGVEDARAWSIFITDKGNMTLTVTMDGTTWTAFGKSMPAADAKP